jgi:hypothetical protein
MAWQAAKCGELFSGSLPLCKQKKQHAAVRAAGKFVAARNHCFHFLTNGSNSDYL